MDDSNPNATNNGGVWPNINSQASSNPNQGVIHGQDMALLQRPLLESPSGSDTSKAGDSIGGSIDEDDGIGDISNRDEAPNIEASRLDEEGTPGEPVAQLQSPQIESLPSIAIELKEPLVQMVTKAGQKDSAMSTTNGNPPNPDFEAEMLEKKRDRPIETDFILDDNRAKKVRVVAASGIGLAAPSECRNSFGKLSEKSCLVGQVPGNLSERCPRVFKKNLAIDGLTSSASATMRENKIPIDVFDDADDDNTLLLGTIAGIALDEKRPVEPVQPDLVASVLGPPKKEKVTKLSMTSGAPVIAAVSVPWNVTKTEPRGPKKTKATKPVKKVWESKKEQDAAKALLRDQVDLGRILSDDDCTFLGEQCRIFTLRQLEFVLDEDTNATNAPDKLRLRQYISQKMLERADLEQESNDVDHARESIETPVTKRNASNIEETYCGVKPEVATNVSGDLTQEVTDRADLLGTSGKSYPLLPTNRMREWKQRIIAWKSTSSGQSVPKQFSLSGVLSQFIPQGTKAFFDSIHLTHVNDFLSLKKTETGLICDMFQAWRNKCGLKPVQSVALAKHLLGIHTRIEMALTTIIDSNDIKWVNDPIIVLTGAAKEFIIDECKIYSAESVVEMRTKYLADQLVEWRKMKGLPALKGSGKVAMVSAWKAVLKDEVEISSTVGKVISKDELKEEAESHLDESPILNKRKSIVEDTTPSKRKVSKEFMASFSTAAAREALISEQFFFDIFGEDERNMRMFKSVGITTARHLIDADKGQNSDFLKAVIAMKAEQNTGNVQASSCIRLLYNWTSKAKQKLSEVEEGKTVEPSRPKRAIDISPPTKAKQPRTLQRDRKSASTDPFQALSSTSKEFLESMGITTAEQFLSTRTTDIANAFIAWREEKNKSTLKGLGAVASVSGWKKLVRNKAASFGDEHLAQLNQASNSKNPIGVRDKGTPRTSGSLSFSTEPVRSTPKKVGGSKRNRFSALSVSKEIVFHFEVDIRCNRDREKTSYLTYLGSDPASEVLGCDSRQIATTNQRNVGAGERQECNETMTDLGDIEGPASGRRAYDSKSFGLIAIECPGVLLDEVERGRKRLLKESVSKFFGLPNDNNQTKRSDRENGPLTSASLSFSKQCNIFGTMESENNCIVYLQEPIEKGQSVELKLSSNVLADMTNVEELNTRRLRELIEKLVSVCSITDLLAIFDSLVQRVIVPLDEQFSMFTTTNGVQTNDIAGASLNTPDLIRKRRKVHWIARKFYNQILSLSSHDEDTSKYSYLKQQVWDKPLFERHRHLPGWDSSSILTEAMDEIYHEIGQSEEVKSFIETRGLWCPLATDIFDSSMRTFAGFLVELESSSIGDGVLKDLCSIVSKAVETVKVAAEKRTNTDAFSLQQFALQYSTGVTGQTVGTFPSREKVFNDVFLRPYDDALQLCGEPGHELDDTMELRFVATQKRTGSLAWKAVVDAESNNDEINFQWYVERQILAVIAAVARGGCAALRPYEGQLRSCEFVESQLIQAARIAAGDTSLALSLFEVREKEKKNQSFPSCCHRIELTKNQYQPNSSPFFHGLVWPILRESGWRLVAGDSPLDVVYCLPSDSKDKNRVGRMKAKIARQRALLARDTSSIGFGYIPKLTKRLLIRCTDSVDDDSVGRAAVSCNVSVDRVVKMFQSSFVQRLIEGGFVSDDMQKRVIDITAEISALFDEIAPNTFSSDECISLEEGKNWKDALGCQYLMRVLLILPVILLEAKIPMRHQESVLAVAKALMSFVSQNVDEFFKGAFDLPLEVYEEEPSAPSSLFEQISSVSHLHANDTATQDDGDKEMTLFVGDNAEIIQISDRALVTEFVACVLDQMIISRATEEDTLRKNRRISVGHPCLVCRHCRGMLGEGKYFFGSNESLSACTTVIEKHLLRCTKLDNTVKEKIMKARVQHSEQRKALPTGAQGAFFAHLFDRLQSMRPKSGSPSSVHIAPLSLDEFKGTTAFDLQSPSSAPDVSDGFKSHIEVMEFLQSHQPWRSIDALGDAIEKYYNCLEYGGTIVNTTKSPLNFSSEWLYAKVAPSKR